MAELQLQQLSKRFADVVALYSLDLAIESGKFVSLLGPSGCGKTTALRIIAGFERATSGCVLVDGKDVSNVPANHRDMGMVFQAYSLFPNMTARENVAFGLRIRRVSRADRNRRASELLELVGLASMLDRYPHQLSGGQQQRVALARALAIEPSVLLLDEPLSALDAKVRVQLREEIRRIQLQLGITALYVTHDQEEALSISDQVVVLSQGRIEQTGSPAEIYGEPATPFVAQFVGTMNRFEGRVAAEGLVKTHDVLLPAEAALGHPAGDRVLLLIRPESIRLEPLNGDVTVPELGVRGTVKVHTFLGPVTRLSIDTAMGELTVDVGSVQALSLAAGTPVALSWDPASPRIIDLPDDGGAASEPVAAAAQPAGGSA
ncbi:MAG TPA: ABC transporter ATP-binding protein [Chloroflexota bacterium]|nr:ABC transporter ATP-binding protein [Chloroflexota bacterium]